MIMAPSWALLILFLACLVAGGFLGGRFTGRGWRFGLASGVITGAVNLLILGSLLGGETPNRVVPSALWWIPGSIAVSAILGVLGASIGARRCVADPERVDWMAAFGRVAATATFLLVIVGGLVTSKEAGLAVVDWPNSYGYNMFLYPLARMTGDIYFEHSHRLFGSLVGLTTLALAVTLWAFDDRAWLKRFALAAFVLVVAQGVIGGLRVTGRLTLSSAPEDMAPSTALAVIHGLLGQVFLGMMVSLAVFVSRQWRSTPVRPSPASATTDRFLTVLLVPVLLVQVATGALVRHGSAGLMVHIVFAVVVLTAAITAGSRAWGLYLDRPILVRLGRLLIVVTAAQLVLGLLAFAATRGRAIGSTPTAFEITATTAHQAGGALLFACAVALMLWTRRLLHPRLEESPAGTRVSSGCRA